jgi:hypothetical protein
MLLNDGKVSSGGGGGEANTGTNVGTAGTGIYDGKSGVSLQFRKLNSLTSALTITLDAPNQKIDLDIDRDALSAAMAYKTEVDEVSSSVTYVGIAAPGTATSAASWQIKKITTTGADIEIIFADGNSNFDNVWDDRASLTYS